MQIHEVTTPPLAAHVDVTPDRLTSLSTSRGRQRFTCLSTDPLLTKTLGFESTQRRTTLPVIWRQASLDARLRQERFTIPSKLDWHLG